MVPTERRVRGSGEPCLQGIGPGDDEGLRVLPQDRKLAKRWMRPGRVRWCTLGLLAMFLATPAVAEWQRVETTAFTLYADTTPDDARQLAVRLDTLRRVIAWRLTGIGRTPGAEADLGTRVLIVLAPGRHDLHVMLGGRSPAIGGLYLDSPDGLAVVAADTGSTGRERHDTLFATYALHIVHEHIGRPLPAWLVGGLADYFGEAELEPGAMRLGRPDDRMLDSLLTLPWTRFQHVLDPRRSTAGDDEVELHAARAQAWLLTHWFLHRPEGAHALDLYLQGASDGRGAEELMQAAFGTTSGGLEMRLRNYAFPTRLRPVPVPDTNQQLDIAATPASSLPDAEVAVALRALIGQGDAAVLARLRLLAQAHPGDLLLMAALGRAERDAGHLDIALQHAVRLVEAGETLQGETLRGTTYLALAGRPEALDAETGGDARPALRKLARNAFATALATQPRHLPALWGYWQAATDNGADVNVEADALLARAYNLAPQCGEVTWALATLLLRRGQDAAGRRLLNDLANTGGAHAARARTLLAQLVVSPD